MKLELIHNDRWWFGGSCSSCSSCSSSEDAEVLSTAGKTLPQSNTHMHTIWKSSGNTHFQTPTIKRTNPENEPFLNTLLVFNVFTSFNLLCGSDLLQASQWPPAIWFLNLHFCSFSFQCIWLVRLAFLTVLRTDLRRFLNADLYLSWGVCTLLT